MFFFRSILKLIFFFRFYAYFMRASETVMSSMNWLSGPRIFWRFESCWLIDTDFLWRFKISVLMLPRSVWKPRSMHSIFCKNLRYWYNFYWFEFWKRAGEKNFLLFSNFFFPKTSRKIEKIYMDSEKLTISLEIRKDRLRIVRIIEDNLKIWVFI